MPFRLVGIAIGVCLDGGETEVGRILPWIPQKRNHLIPMRETSGPVAKRTLPALAPMMLAHEGHGESAWYGTVLHYLMEPMHWSLIHAGLLAIAVVWRRLSNKSQQQKRLHCPEKRQSS